MKTKIIEKIKQQIADNPVLLYMKGTPEAPQCGYSKQAVSILDACGVEFAHVNILEETEIREELKIYSDWPTYPQLYIRGELIGGSDIMLELFQEGELQKILAGEDFYIEEDEEIEFSGCCGGSHGHHHDH